MINLSVVKSVKHLLNGILTQAKIFTHLYQKCCCNISKSVAAYIGL